MKASKFFSDAQKAFILKQGDDGVPVAEICRRACLHQNLLDHKAREISTLETRKFEEGLPL
jgi:hypothetical protein